jgi:hypothetical protein
MRQVRRTEANFADAGATSPGGRALVLARAIGGVRVGVGIALLMRPKIAGSTDASTRLLVHTIGVRDVALGLGTLLAGGAASSSWVRAGLASDAADVVLGLRSVSQLGRGGLVAAAAPLPVIAAGVAHARAVRR